jgi:hypothetical protein
MNRNALAALTSQTSLQTCHQPTSSPGANQRRPGNPQCTTPENSKER